MIQLTHAFVRAVGDRAFVSVQNSIQLDEVNLPQPDLAVLRPSAAYGARLPAVSDVFLVVEVADSTLAYDRKSKSALYAALGLRHER